MPADDDSRHEYAAHTHFGARYRLASSQAIHTRVPWQTFRSSQKLTTGFFKTAMGSSESVAVFFVP